MHGQLGFCATSTARGMITPSHRPVFPSFRLAGTTPAHPPQCGSRRKDRTSFNCVLAPEEALRFDRAIYRYWLWLEMVQEDAVWKEGDSSDDDNDDNDQETVAQLRDEFVTIVKALPTEELLEILHVAAFVGETRLWRASWSKSDEFLSIEERSELSPVSSRPVDILSHLECGPGVAGQKSSRHKCRRSLQLRILGPYPRVHQGRIAVAQREDRPIT